MIRAGLLLLTIVLVASGCGVAEQKRQAYLTSQSIAPLQLPDSLTPPVSDDALMLPELPPATSAAAPFDSSPPEPANFPVEVKPEINSETRE
ncbi:MAG: hypothetical protein U1B30_03015 [Pseudomonadota bacterium]|nr:hypothetical protein [Pseudomonadota bacterium]